MPFLAECILCNQKVRVPDRAAGGSVQCPRCGSHFTAVPVEDLFPAARTSGAAGEPIAAAKRPVESAKLPPPFDAPATADVTPSLGDQIVAALPAVPRPRLTIPIAVVEAPAARRWLDPVGITSLALVGVAGWCTLSYVLGLLVIPLAVLGLLTGLAGLAVAVLSGRYRLGLAVAGTLLNSVLIFFAIIFPATLGPAFQLSRARAEPEAFIARAIPLPGQKAVGSTEDTAEWVDASRFSLKFKNVRVQVVGVAFRPVEVGAQAKKKFTKASYLVVRVRAYQPAGAVEFAARSGDEPETAKERPVATLADGDGNVYPAAPASVAAEAGELVQKSNVFPLGITDEIYLFEAPSAGASSLRLEVPATTWGGTGVLRFAIPTTMIRAETSAAPSGPAIKTKH